MPLRTSSSATIAAAVRVSKSTQSNCWNKPLQKTEKRIGVFQANLFHN